MFFALCFQGFVFVLFLYVFEQVGIVKRLRTLRRAAKTACAENKKDRSRARFGMDLGVIFGVQLATTMVFCRTNECKKTS